MNKSLEQYLSSMDVELPAAARAGLFAFPDLLAKWNRVYNLTAIRSPERMLTHHLLDSLAILPYLHGARLLDVGSGAGLPAIPLALARPDLSVTALDSNAKKVRFITQAKLELQLDNLEAVQGRVETFHAPAPYSCIVSRAFASISRFVDTSSALLAVDGRMLAMKGTRPDDEIEALPAGYRVLAVHSLQIPGLDAARHLVEITRAN